MKMVKKKTEIQLINKIANSWNRMTEREKTENVMVFPTISLLASLGIILLCFPFAKPENTATNAVLVSTIIVLISSVAICSTFLKNNSIRGGL